MYSSVKKWPRRGCLQELRTSAGWVSALAWAFTVLGAGRGEAAQGPPCVFLPQAHRSQGRPPTEDYTHLQPQERTKRNKRQSLPLPSSLSFLVPGENDHKVLPFPSGTNAKRFFELGAKANFQQQRGWASRVWGSFRLCLSSSNTGRAVSPQKARWC